MPKVFDSSNPVDRQEMIQLMDRISSEFYGKATFAGVHAFIEFAGLMNEFIQVCRAAQADGMDFTQANTHTGNALPFMEHNARYLAEKLNCIYGPALTENEAFRSAFIDKLLEGRFKLVPVMQEMHPEP